MARFKIFGTLLLLLSEFGADRMYRADSLFNVSFYFLSVCIHACTNCSLYGLVLLLNLQIYHLFILTLTMCDNCVIE